MEQIILQTNHLTKKFGHFIALDNVNITLYEKHIYGFIGENGAGKTTLMRILTGLLYPTSGCFSLFGRKEQRAVERERRKIGSTIEAPALYPHYTAYQNLELQRILVGNPDKQVCDEILHLVDLYEVRYKKVHQFSMGMKQRLSLALALIGKPSVLILDEPINGLDPKNIAALRETLLRLNKEKNMTLFVSSHILSELYLLATDYIIIHKGMIMETLTQQELEAKCRKYIRIRTEDVPRCLTVLEKELHQADYKVVSDNTIYLYSYIERIREVWEVLTKHQIVVTELTISEQNLEEYFLSVIGGGQYV